MKNRLFNKKKIKKKKLMIRNSMKKTIIYIPLFEIVKSNELDLRLSTDIGFSEF